MYLADAEIDETAFNSFFGSSVVEYAKFFSNVFVEGFHRPDELGQYLWGDDVPITPVKERKWTQYIAVAHTALLPHDAACLFRGGQPQGVAGAAHSPQRRRACAGRRSAPVLLQRGGELVCAGGADPPQLSNVGLLGATSNLWSSSACRRRCYGMLGCGNVARSVLYCIFQNFIKYPPHSDGFR